MSKINQLVDAAVAYVDDSVLESLREVREDLEILKGLVKRMHALTEGACYMAGCGNVEREMKEAIKIIDSL